MKVIVCGGRHYNNRACVFDQLDALHNQSPIETLIHGDAPGADRIGGAWARQRKIPIIRCPAKWRVDGRYVGPAAGPIRNAFMLTLSPDLVVAFPGNTGTADMVRQAKKAGVPVKEIAA